MTATPFASFPFRPAPARGFSPPRPSGAARGARLLAHVVGPDRRRGLGGGARRGRGRIAARQPVSPSHRRASVAGEAADLLARSAGYILAVLGLLYAVERAMTPL